MVFFFKKKLYKELYSIIFFLQLLIVYETKINMCSISIKVIKNKIENITKNFDLQFAHFVRTKSIDDIAFLILNI